ncbi:MAG: LON peptidase substrate-binding domain-containing protein [Clostridiales bacterium]|nr:MAG: LON peptidase substrate-binding domain-containing protein [Clostridiales bacterium]
MLKISLYFFDRAEKNPLINAPMRDELFWTGTVARIKQVLKLPENNARVLVEGISRARISEIYGGRSVF